jgi:quercetin dioxygenase-like cupin family protein
MWQHIGRMFAHCRQSPLIALWLPTALRQVGGEGLTSGVDQMNVLFTRPMLVFMVGLCTSMAYAINDTYPEATVSTVLLKATKSWNGASYNHYPIEQPELTVLKVLIPPHSALPWHKHPIPSAAYVMSGTLRVESRDGRYQATLHAGDVLPEMVGTVHRGWTGDTAVELIVFYAGAKVCRLQ